MLIPSIFSENVFDEFFRNPFFDDRDTERLEKKIYGRRGENLMETDIRETDTEYELEMDLPGFRKGRVKVSLKDGYLTICAAKGLDRSEQEKNSGRYIRRKHYAGACERSSYMDGDMTDENIKGKFKHGVLRLSIPKEGAKPLAEKKKYMSIKE